MPNFTVSIPAAAVPMVQAACVAKGWDNTTPIAPFLQQLFIDSIKAIVVEYKITVTQEAKQLEIENAVGAAVTEIDTAFL